VCRRCLTLSRGGTKGVRTKGTPLHVLQQHKPVALKWSPLTKKVCVYNPLGIQ
jgi:hypothetical protein